MHDILLKNLARFIELTPEEIEYLLSVLQLKKLRKRQYLLQEGDVCKIQGFVVKGCLRVYEVDAKGTEHIVQFAPEDWWVGDIYSFYTGEKSQYNIDALEDSELYIFKNSRWM